LQLAATNRRVQAQEHPTPVTSQFNCLFLIKPVENDSNSVATFENMVYNFHDLVKRLLLAENVPEFQHPPSNADNRGPLTKQQRPTQTLKASPGHSKNSL